MTSDIEHLFMCFWDLWMFSFVKMLVQVFCSFKKLGFKKIASYDFFTFSGYAFCVV